MNQRELYMQRTLKVAQRLKELGLRPPNMPEANESEFNRCKACRGVGYISLDNMDGEEEKGHCPECGGSGQIVNDKLLEWNLEIAKIAQGIRRFDG